MPVVVIGIKVRCCIKGGNGSGSNINERSRSKGIEFRWWGAGDCELTVAYEFCITRVFRSHPSPGVWCVRFFGRRGHVVVHMFVCVSSGVFCECDQSTDANDTTLPMAAAPEKRP